MMTDHPGRIALVALVSLAAPVAFLAGCNGKTGGGLKPGQYPVPDPADPGARRTPAQSAGAKAWRVPKGVTARKWRYIVIHHSGTDEGSAAAFDRYHRNVRGWKDLAYHFVIGNGRGTADGAVEVGPRWKGQRAGAHAGVQKYNSLGIGICLVGNFEKSVPTKKQREALARLLQFLMKRFGVKPADVKRHSDVVQTKCPGKRFPWPVVKSSR
ncbi:MAG: peptidoglycan recognition protein family protein [Planctomycetota bacterium]|jgi:N-acetyl-anhydromuramyl-L-alanine amidase AmpD